MRYLAKKILLRIGIWLSHILPRRSNSELFFFFPFYHVGGSERVHADILEVASTLEPWIIITNRSNHPTFRERFGRDGKLLDISSIVSNYVLQVIATGYFVAVINRCRKPLVFCSNSPFYYALIPFLREDVYCVDMIHAFGTGLETISLPNVERIDRRIVINKKTYEDLRDQYGLHGLDSKFAERIDLVENKVKVPVTFPQRVENEKLRVIYVGRGTEEKRVHLVGRIASLCHNKGLPVEFTLAGDVTDAVDSNDRQYCRFMGEIHDSACIDELYLQSDLLLVTSSREGFPMVIMEAMAHGVVPITTDVGGIRYHIRTGENGFLVRNSSDEVALVGFFASFIEQMHLDRALLARMSGVAYGYAAAHFKGEAFDSYYSNLFMGSRSM